MISFASVNDRSIQFKQFNNVMRKNRSVKDNSIARGRGSRGKEISIELEPKPAKKDSNTSRYNQEQQSSSQVTDRLNYSSSWHQNPSISQNILKQIINYSNVPQSSGLRSSKGATVAVYQKNDNDIFAQFSKISKKTSICELNSKTLGMRKESKKLVIDQTQSNIRSTNIAESIELIASKCQQSQSVNANHFESQISKQNEQISKYDKLGLRRQDINYEKLTALTNQKQQCAMRMDELTMMEQSINIQYSEMIPIWEDMMSSQNKCQQFQNQVNILQQQFKDKQEELQCSNLRLLFINKQFVTSRREWDLKGNGDKIKVLEQAQSTHGEFIKRLTYRDFQETVLFNMKVAIPDHRGKTNLRGIYQELFRSHSTKKFTMILKKHTTQMDLYDGKLLSDFVKKINDLQGQYLRSDNETFAHPDEEYIQRMAQTVTVIQKCRSEHEDITSLLKKKIQKLKEARDKYKSNQQKMNMLIDELNYQVRDQYVRECQKNADFKTLLLSKYNAKYRQMKQIKQERGRLSQFVSVLQQKVQWISASLLA